MFHAAATFSSAAVLGPERRQSQGSPAAEPDSHSAHGIAKLPADASSAIDSDDLSGHIAGIPDQVKDAIGDIARLPGTLHRDLPQYLVFYVVRHIAIRPENRAR